MSSTLRPEGIPEVRLWKIQNKELIEILKPKLDLEERLENWIASDISIIEDFDYPLCSVSSLNFSLSII